MSLLASNPVKSHLTLQTWHWPHFSSTEPLIAPTLRSLYKTKDFPQKSYPQKGGHDQIHTVFQLNRELAPQLPNGLYWLEGNRCSVASESQPFWYWLYWALQSLDSGLQPFFSPTTRTTATPPQCPNSGCVVGKLGIQFRGGGARCSLLSHGHIRTQLHPEQRNMRPSRWITKCYSEKHISLIWRQWMLVWFIQRHYLTKLVLEKVMGGDFNTNTVISPRHLGYNYKPYVLL